MKRNTVYDDLEKKLIDQAKVDHVPILGCFELTKRCNFDCKMCYVHQSNDVDLLNKELTTDQLFEIFDDAFQMGMLFAVFSGGECLLRTDFKKLYLHLYKKGVQISVNTNGFLLNDDYISFFKLYPPRQIQISLYGSNNDVYESVTGKRVFDHIFSVLLKVKDAGLRLQIALTPSKYLQNDIINIISFLKGNSFHYIINPFLLDPREETESGFNYQSNIEEQVEIAKQIRLAKGKPILPRQPDSLPETGCACSDICYGMPCSAGNARFTLNWDGYIVPCIALETPRLDAVKLGFSACWAQLLDNNSKIIQPVECTECAYKPACIRCMAIRTKDVYSGHCNRDICALAKAKVIAGVSRI